MLSRLLPNLLRAAVLWLAFGAGGAAVAQPYPARQVTVIVPYGAGGGTDLLARAIADDLTQRLGQKFLVENAPGAGGTLGTRKAMAAPADGYTLLLGSGSELELAQITEPQADLGSWKPLDPVGLVGTQPMVLVGKPALPPTLDELVTLARQRPGELSYASAGFGTQLHVLGELLKMESGLSITHVPYKAAGQIAADVIGGHVDLAVMVLPSALPHIRSGKVRAYGISNTVRSPSAPEIPTINESRAFDKVDMKIWYGLFAPAGTPPGAVARISQALAEALRSPPLRARLGDMVLDVPEDSSPAALLSTKASGLARIRTVFETLKPR